MNFGLMADEYDYINEHVVSPIEARGGRVFCYGSRARGDHKQYSDLDLMVEADRDLSTLISQLQEMLTRSNFPYKVEIVELSNFADAYKPGYLQDRVPFLQPVACHPD